MPSITTSPNIHHLLEEREEQHTLRRLALSVSAKLRLEIHNPSLVLAPLLQQPVQRSNLTSLIEWVKRELEDIDTESDGDLLEQLCSRLQHRLSEL